jgi:hypothetical protein
LALSGLWGSFFSRIEGEAMKTPFRRGLFSKISLRAATQVSPTEATPDRLFNIVKALRGEEK